MPIHILWLTTSSWHKKGWKHPKVHPLLKSDQSDIKYWKFDGRIIYLFVCYLDKYFVKKVANKQINYPFSSSFIKITNSFIHSIILPISCVAIFFLFPYFQHDFVISLWAPCPLWNKSYLSKSIACNSYLWPQRNK